MWRNFRLLRSLFFIFLPTVVVVGMSIWFALEDLPRIVASEKGRMDKKTKEVADQLLVHPEMADFTWRQGEGIVSGDRSWAEAFPANRQWKDWPSLGPAKSKEKWGWLDHPEGCVVWVRDIVQGRDDKVVYGRQTDLRERDYFRYFLIFGGFSLFVLIGITFLGARYFIDYVKTRDDFMAATAHDLTTPLVGLRFLIGRDDEEARHLNERLIRLVDNIKDFLRLGGKRRPPRREAFDLLKAYREAYLLFREDYRDVFDGEDVAVEIPPEGESALMALGDETMTQQILWNLLGNDLKYAAPYGRVMVRFRCEGAAICVDFIDEGKGMTSGERARAFDRYYRAKTVLESGKGGFGIGLCTAREFAEAMGGRLTVRANEPTGCVFTFKIPRAS